MSEQLCLPRLEGEQATPTFSKTVSLPYAHVQGEENQSMRDKRTVEGCSNPTRVAAEKPRGSWGDGSVTV